MDYNIFGTRSNSGVVGIILVVILLALLVNIKPNYFKYLFKTFLGNLILGFSIILIGSIDIKWGIGVAAVAFIIYQAFQISCVNTEGFEGSSNNANKCKPGCSSPKQPSGNCILSEDGKTVSCPWECSTNPDNYNFNKYGSGSNNCVYDSECSSCGKPITFANPVVQSDACFDSQFGCCPDGNTTKTDADGSNCPTHKKTISKCFTSEYGCCPDGITPSVDTEGSNCSAPGSSSYNPWDNKDVFSRKKTSSDRYNNWDDNSWDDNRVNNGNKISSDKHPYKNWDNAEHYYKRRGYKNTGSTSGKPETGITSSNSSKNLWGLFPEGYPIPKTIVWPNEIIEKFIKFQKLHNPDLRFDLDIIQRQASSEEAETLLRTGKWPWTPDVINLYKKAIFDNNIIRNEPGAALSKAQTVYNQMAIVELLSWNTKEGSFLLNGAIVGHTKNMPKNINNLVRCGKDESTGKTLMQKIVYNGYNGINGSLISSIKSIANSDIPKEVNGFKFLKSECNPCSALDDPADYSCPFSLNVGDGNKVSSVWQQLWGLNSSGEIKPGLKKTDALSPDNVESVGSDFNKKDFPLLNQLASEVMKGAAYVNVSFKKPSDVMSNTNEGQNIGSVSGSSVPAVITNGDPEQKN